MLLERIKLLCKENKISQRKLEKALNLGNGATSKWVKSSPSIETLNKIADHFHVSVDYLLGNVNEPYFYLDNKRILREINDGTDTEKAPTEAGAMMIRESAQEYSAEPTKKDLRYALSGEVTDLTDEQLDEIINYAKYVSAKRKDNK